MKPLKVGVIDLVSKGPTNTLWAQTMYANLASIMPQVVATWCEQEGHKVTMMCYTGREDLRKEMPQEMDIVFICSFTQAALLAYALSNYFRNRRIVTVLGGPHARCYPDDALHYFDYVLGFTHKSTVVHLLNNHEPQSTTGQYISESRQPLHLPGVAERWKFIAPTLKKSPLLKIVPMLGSIGCPYTCSFCIDSTVPYQALDGSVIREDLRFLLTQFKRPLVAWHDPNFGVRFQDNMEAIASAAPPKSFQFIAESSLSILTEEHLEVMKNNGFKALLPGVESWYELGNKSRTSHIAGAEPFELTKRFIDKTPAAFPGYSLLSAFGEAAPLNLEYQKAGRVLPFPFHFLNNHLAMNIKPRNYEWVDFYDKVIDLTAYTFSPKAIFKRFCATANRTSKWMNVMRAVSSEGYGRLRFYHQVRKNLVENRPFRQYFEGETKQLPSFYLNIIRKDLGIWWPWLPEGAWVHNPNAYLAKTSVRPKA